MNDTVSFETAVQLKEAGFPQERRGMQDGHMTRYYAPDEGIGVLWAASQGSAGLGRFFSAPNSLEFYEFEQRAFAPTATNILREIDAELEAASNKYYWINLSPLGTIWEVSVRRAGAQQARFFTHKNPAEAAALAYEWVKSKKIDEFDEF